VPSLSWSPFGAGRLADSGWEWAADGSGQEPDEQTERILFYTGINDKLGDDQRRRTEPVADHLDAAVEQAHARNGDHRSGRQGRLSLMADFGDELLRVG
jgi:hypothetical protein